MYFIYFPHIIRMEEHFHTLEGSGIAEDKRYINSKSPWTLAHLNAKLLKAFYNNPAVPPSMKKKLKEAMMIKPTLKGKLKGGLKGVSKASGFIRRLMWENSNKHKGSYGNPTWELAPGSRMSKKAKFEYSKLATPGQKGSNSKGAYGASPFIKHHFATLARQPKAKSAQETDDQKKARKDWKKPQEQMSVEAETTIPSILESHFANQVEEKPEEPKVEPKPEPKEEPPKKRVFKVKKEPILGGDVYKNTSYGVFVKFWKSFTSSIPKKLYSDMYLEPLTKSAYGSDGFWADMIGDAPRPHSSLEGKKELYANFLKQWADVSKMTDTAHNGDKDFTYFVPKDADWIEKKGELIFKKDLMGISYTLWRIGKLLEKGWKVILANCPYDDTRGERLIVVSPNSEGYDFGDMFVNGFFPRDSYTTSNYGVKVTSVVYKDGQWEFGSHSPTTVFKEMGDIKELAKEAMELSKDKEANKPFVKLEPDNVGKIIEDYMAKKRDRDGVRGSGIGSSRASVAPSPSSVIEADVRKLFSHHIWHNGVYDALARIKAKALRMGMTSVEFHTLVNSVIEDDNTGGGVGTSAPRSRWFPRIATWSPRVAPEPEEAVPVREEPSRNVGIVIPTPPPVGQTSRLSERERKNALKKLIREYREQMVYDERGTLITRLKLWATYYGLTEDDFWEYWVDEMVGDNPQDVVETDPDFLDVDFGGSRVKKGKGKCQSKPSAIAPEECLDDDFDEELARAALDELWDDVEDAFEETPVPQRQEMLEIFADKAFRMGIPEDMYWDMVYDIYSIRKRNDPSGVVDTESDEEEGVNGGMCWDKKSTAAVCPEPPKPKPAKVVPKKEPTIADTYVLPRGLNAPEELDVNYDDIPPDLLEQPLAIQRFYETLLTHVRQGNIRYVWDNLGNMGTMEDGYEHGDAIARLIRTSDRVGLTPKEAKYFYQRTIKHHMAEQGIPWLGGSKMPIMRGL